MRHRDRYPAPPLFIYLFIFILFLFYFYFIFIYFLFYFIFKGGFQKPAPGGTRTRNLCLRRAAPYPLGHKSCNQEMFGWCSWLSRAPHTREVPSSILGSNMFFFSPPPLSHQEGVAGVMVSIAAFQAVDPGSIPGPRNFFFFVFFFFFVLEKKKKNFIRAAGVEPAT